MSESFNPRPVTHEFEGKPYVLSVKPGKKSHHPRTIYMSQEEPDHQPEQNEAQLPEVAAIAEYTSEIVATRDSIWNDNPSDRQQEQYIDAISQEEMPKAA